MNRALCGDGSVASNGLILELGWEVPGERLSPGDGEAAGTDGV